MRTELYSLLLFSYYCHWGALLKFSTRVCTHKYLHYFLNNVLYMFSFDLNLFPSVYFEIQYVSQSCTNPK